jgi:hypothetical protein
VKDFKHSINSIYRFYRRVELTVREK